MTPTNLTLNKLAAELREVADYAGRQASMMEQGAGEYRPGERLRWVEKRIRAVLDRAGVLEKDTKGKLDMLPMSGAEIRDAVGVTSTENKIARKVVRIVHNKKNEGKKS